MKVFVVLDMDAEKKDCIEGIYGDRDHAVESAAILNDMRVGGATTRIQIHDVHYAHSRSDQFRERLVEIALYDHIKTKADILNLVLKAYNEVHK